MYALKLTEKNGKYTFTMPTGKVTVKGSFVEEAPVQIFKDVPVDAYYYEAVKWAAEKGITGGVGNGLFAPNQPCTRAQIVTFLWRAAGSPAPKHMSSFADVPADAFYAKAVAWAVENGITGGTGDGKFSPDATCTRAQAVTFLYRASGSPAVGGGCAFGDVAATAYYADAVAWAENNKITSGIGGGLFGSDNDCTRAQIVTFLYRSVK
ncbi:S-layer homology domain-containing protein [Oscillibacter sp. MSJ-31]|uniref:S-layer homology domain-containing protein n=1 Tax=Oscillibacter sp. MSJ-31 TaxID=2841526 RepID=UPI001C102596|nr:S-layer homology domain-containing protein [Oscillibacter sp. MSJ-31]MBU5458350.1 S-layer homology domain-containing protein [Oscillibacter sp. MSJ-31]